MPLPVRRCRSTQMDPSEASLAHAAPDRRVLFLSTSSEMDFGQPGVQYVDFPQFAERATHAMGLFPPERWVHRPSWLRAAYLRAGRMLSGFSEEGVRANLTLTVSDWTGEIVRKGVRNSDENSLSAGYAGVSFRAFPG